MTALARLETTLAKVLDKNAPVKLPKEARKSVAYALWWIALAVGVLQLLATFGLWHAGHVANKFVDYANTISAQYGGPVYAPAHLGMFYYLSVFAMAGVAVLLLVAAPGLKAMKKGGWDFLFYASLVQVGAAIVRLFSNINGGIGSFVGSAIGALVGGFFLFQVRDYFMGKKVPSSKTNSERENTKENYSDTSSE